MGKGRPSETYALYKGEEVIAIGTKKEISIKTGLKEKTLSFYRSPAYQKRSKNNKNRKILIKVE